MNEREQLRRNTAISRARGDLAQHVTIDRGRYARALPWRKIRGVGASKVALTRFGGHPRRGDNAKESRGPSG